MNRLRSAILCAGIALILVGCEGDGRSFYGYAEPKTTGTATWIATPDTFSTKSDTVYTIAKYEGLPFTESYKIQYKVLVGGETEGALAEGTMLATEDEDYIVRVEYGAAYFVGDRPYGSASGGGASSEGSIIVVQSQVDVDGTGPDGARFFFLEGDSMTVKNAAGSEVVVTIPFYYVEVAKDGTLDGPFAVPSSGAIRDFVTDLIKRADAKGLGTP